MHRSSRATLFRGCVAGPTHAPAIGVKAFGLWEGELISSSGATLFRGCVAGPAHAPAIGVRAFGLQERAFDVDEALDVQEGLRPCG